MVLLETLWEKTALESIDVRTLDFDALSLFSVQCFFLVVT